MRLDFNVLWVEDQPNLVAASVTALQRSMAEEGFELRHTFCTDVDGVTAYLADDVFRDEVDLILVDWDLGAGLKGEAVISQVRETIPYKDIVFYSAHPNVRDELRQASFNAGHE